MRHRCCCQAIPCDTIAGDPSAYGVSLAIEWTDEGGCDRSGTSECADLDYDGSDLTSTGSPIWVKDFAEPFEYLYCGGADAISRQAYVVQLECGEDSFTISVLLEYAVGPPLTDLPVFIQEFTGSVVLGATYVLDELTPGSPGVAEYLLCSTASASVSFFAL